MELIIGILLGSILGILLNFIPGFNIGFALMSASIIPDARFAIGLIIGVDVVTSSFKHLSLLHAKHREDLDENITNAENKQNLCIESAYQYFFIKILFGLAACGMVFFYGNSIFDIGSKTIAMLGFGGAIILWGSLIQLSKYKWVAAIAFLTYCSFSWIAKDLGIQQSMFVIASSLFSANLINTFRYKPEKIQLSNEIYHTKGTWNNIIEGSIAGIASAFLWGLPTNAVCRLFEDNDATELKVARHAVADAVASIGGITILLTTGGAKSAAASSAAAFNESFHHTEVVVILFIIVILTGVIAHNWDTIMTVYSAIHNKIPHLLSRIIVIFTVAALVIMSNGLFPVTCLICFMINKLTKVAETPRELSLSSLVFVPIIGLGIF
ncbi:hypothetical protein [Nostoc sp. CALU 1950]|uniref:hypothetical protein n=1 Tax=Nostoc sp. CALU 1950 TaxID=3104321 RepID=UPI003EB8C40A